jgi:hypothetical protein
VNAVRRGRTWEEASLKNTENKAERNHLPPFVDKAEADGEDAPCQACARQEPFGTHLAQNDRRWGLQEDVGEEEDQSYDAVASTEREHEVVTHASDDGNSQVRTVHERCTVHEAQRQDETAVDSPDDGFLLLLGEGIDASIVVRGRVAVDFLDVDALSLLGLLMCGHCCAGGMCCTR